MATNRPGPFFYHDERGVTMDLFKAGFMERAASAGFSTEASETLFKVSCHLDAADDSPAFRAAFNDRLAKLAQVYQPQQPTAPAAYAPKPISTGPVAGPTVPTTPPTLRMPPVPRAAQPSPASVQATPATAPAFQASPPVQNQLAAPAAAV